MPHAVSVVPPELGLLVLRVQSRFLLQHVQQSRPCLLNMSFSFTDSSYQLSPAPDIPVHACSAAMARTGRVRHSNKTPTRYFVANCEHARRNGQPERLGLRHKLSAASPRPPTPARKTGAADAARRHHQRKRAEACDGDGRRTVEQTRLIEIATRRAGGWSTTPFPPPRRQSSVDQRLKLTQRKVGFGDPEIPRRRGRPCSA